MFEAWRQKIKTEGITSAREQAAQLQPHIQPAIFHVAHAVIAEYEEEQATARHDAQMEELVKTRTLQDECNTIQKCILIALIVFPIVTIALTFLIAIFKD